ncbi:MAG: DEAD/DEAH box helicase [Ilumatobacteraceae bacterium]
MAEGRRWTFDSDGSAFKLASEARRIQLAHLFDPFAAISSATIQPLLHQIEAVYGRLLPLQPLRFLLADDPGAGKTIMSGLYIRELMLRGDLDRCLVIAPGSLVEQWHEELDDKFGLRFDILSRDMVEAARTGNPFQERNLLIARLDQLSRSEELQAKLGVTDWDLVIVDEAHKMSARLYGDEVTRTLRFQLGELIRDRTRNLLLLTATPQLRGHPDRAQPEYTSARSQK